MKIDRPKKKLILNLKMKESGREDDKISTLLL